MAMRGGPGRLITGNPLGGMLRDLNRQTRRTTRRTGTVRPPADVEGGQEPSRPPGVPQPARPSGPVAAVAVTGEDGRAQWAFPVPFGRPPVLSVVPVDPEPEDDERTVTAVVEEVASWYAVVRVWRTRPRRGAGVVEPAGPGVRVHITALEEVDPAAV
ncbi:hypothetical protein [Streptomyces sp. NPDC003393]